MSITSASDFIGEYNIPNRTDPNTGEQIQWFINKYEPELLTYLLGADLYAQLKAGLAEDPILGKWAALRDEVKVSIICYVYSWYRRDNATSFSGTGEIVSKNENSEVISPIVKMIDRWNEMVQNNHKVVCLIDKDTTVYGEYFDTCYRRHGIFQIQNTFGL